MLLEKNNWRFLSVFLEPSVGHSDTTLLAGTTSGGKLYIGIGSNRSILTMDANQRQHPAPGLQTEARILSAGTPLTNVGPSWELTGLEGSLALDARRPALAEKSDQAVIFPIHQSFGSSTDYG